MVARTYSPSGGIFQQSVCTCNATNINLMLVVLSYIKTAQTTLLIGKRHVTHTRIVIENSTKYMKTQY